MILHLPDRGTVYYRKSYIGWDPGLDGLDTLLSNAMGVPLDAINTRRLRYAPKLMSDPQVGLLHVTLVTPPELKTMFQRVGGTQEQVVEHLLGVFRPLAKVSGPTITPVLREETYELDKKPGVFNRSYLVDVDWPMAQAMRRTVGLSATKLHFTLGIEEVAR